MVTPFDREDIHELTESLDTAVDNMRAAVDLLRLHNITEPIPGVAEFGDLLAKAGEATVAAMKKLSRLRDLHGHLNEIDELETRGDHLYREMTAQLFSGAYKASWS